MLTFKNIIISILLAISIILSGWSFLKSNHSDNVVVTDTENRPDAFMENVSALVTNRDGKATLKIESPKMIHYHNNDMTYIEKPHIIIYRQTSEPWHINSDFAKATKGIDQILFWDNVVIRHEPDEGNPETTIKTATLTVFPHDQIAKTEDKITLLQPNTSVYGIGLLANMNNGSIKLLKEARGDYAPNS